MNLGVVRSYIKHKFIKKNNNNATVCENSTLCINGRSLDEVLNDPINETPDRPNFNERKTKIKLKTNSIINHNSNMYRDLYIKIIQFDSLDLNKIHAHDVHDTEKLFKCDILGLAHDGVPHKSKLLSELYNDIKSRGLKHKRTNSFVDNMDISFDNITKCGFNYDDFCTIFSTANVILSDRMNYSDPIIINEKREILCRMKKEKYNKCRPCHTKHINIIKGFNSKKIISPIIKITKDSTYNSIFESANPLDLIAFKKPQSVISFDNYNEENIDSIFTHIGIVVTKDILPDLKLEPNKLYVWESTMKYNIPTISSDKCTTNGDVGIRVLDLEKICNNKTDLGYSDIALGQLMYNPWITKDYANASINEQRLYIINKFKAMHKNCYNIYTLNKKSPREKSTKNIFYTNSKPKILNTNITDSYGVVMTIGLDNTNNKINTMFSSIMIGLLYKKIGILPKRININTLTAIDFFRLDQIGFPNIIKSILYLD